MPSVNLFEAAPVVSAAVAVVGVVIAAVTLPLQRRSAVAARENREINAERQHAELTPDIRPRVVLTNLSAMLTSTSNWSGRQGCASWTRSR